MPKPTIILSSGEPAGIGPDIIAAIEPASFDARLVVIGDQQLLTARAQSLGSPLNFIDYATTATLDQSIEVLHQPLSQGSVPGKLNPANAEYVLNLLREAGQACLRGEFDAMVTAPVQKDVINSAGFPFTGHTEYLADLCDTAKSVMLLHANQLRVALLTTHLPLRQVADAISIDSIQTVVKILDRDLRSKFGIANPRIKVCGLNPHAGENGYLGREEIEIITPAIESLRTTGILVTGPYPADSVFTTRSLADTDVILAMYHDQGLPVIKHVGFHNAVNTTLGLPIIRTSVDHGTALDLAGTKSAQADSLFAAINAAIFQANNSFNASST